jgi:dihydropteroate synthase
MTDLDIVGRESTPRPRPRIMGILNVTPDSFSDGGRFDEADAAIEHGLALVAAGADLVDIGGESTRPGAERVSVEAELDRVLPVIRGLVEQRVGVSIDTMNAETAQAAIEAGAEIINDVSGGLADPEMYRIVAETGATYIASHWRGHLDGTDADTYDDVVYDVRHELKGRIAELIVWGVNPRRIVVDPGLGFSKNADQNWRLLGHLPALATLGYPVLVGASRKRFLGDLIADDAPAADRDPATAITSALAAEAGAWGVRVHNVADTKAALDVWDRWERGANS